AYKRQDELLRRLRLLDDQPVDDLASRRAGAPVSDTDGSMPLGAVAYSGPDEDAEREDADGEYD
ncbi:hypothetical protein, partial [Enterococcus faecium]|uniref:hypothetical protein n=1 Tax=Enterococcus faecium TaxID=1352 RepID=UPI000E05C059